MSGPQHSALISSIVVPLPEERLGNPAHLVDVAEGRALALGPSRWLTRPASNLTGSSTSGNTPSSRRDLLQASNVELGAIGAAVGA